MNLRRILSKKFRNQLIRTKIAVIYVPLVAIPILFLGAIFSIIFTNSITEKTVKSVLDNSNLIITRIDSIITNAESCANVIVTSINYISEINSGKKSDQIDQLVMRNQILSQLNIACTAFPDVQAAIFVDKDFQTFSTDVNIENGIEDARNLDIIKQIERTNGKNIWFPMQKRNDLGSNNKNPVLTLGKKVIEINSGKTLGFVILVIKEDTLARVFSKVGPINKSGYFIADENGRVVSSREKGDLLSPVPVNQVRQWVLAQKKSDEILEINRQKVLLTSVPFENFNWRLVNKIPLKELTEDMDKITFVIMVLGLLCIVIALSGAGILSRVIARPIITLTRNILKIKDGNLDVYCSVKSDDEIGQLASGFNTMLDRIKELLKNIKNEQQKKREYELALMQAQIKPHFLYNTLDLIYILCEMERNNEAKGITKALADFYRVALSNGREIITLEEEIKNVRDYLIIQRMRYSDVFEFDIRVDEGINHCKIPKLLIQPLVENSIYHGLKPKDSFGKIIVEAFRLNSLVVIRVTDNGVGMEEEKLKELLSPDSGQNAKTSFGLGSIHERIKLYYGEEYGLTIKSRPGLGTEATVTMPETDRSEGNA